MKKITFVSSGTILAASLVLLPSYQGLSAEQQNQKEQAKQSQQTEQPGQQGEKSKDEIKVSEQDLDQKVSDVNKASKLTGMEVRNKQDEKIGKISDVVIDLKSGRVAYAVLSTGGTLGAGGKMIAVPVQALTVEKGKKNLLLEMDKQQLKDAPGFAKNAWPPLNAAETGKTVGLAAQQKSQEASGGTESEKQQTSGKGSGGSAITDLKELTASADPSSVEGRQVQLSGATVKEVLGEKLVTLSSPEGQAVAVKTKESAKELKPDQKVNVSGKAHKMPQDPSQLGVDQQGAQKLQGQQLYIEARQLTPASQ